MTFSTKLFRSSFQKLPQISYKEYTRLDFLNSFEKKVNVISKQKRYLDVLNSLQERASFDEDMIRKFVFVLERVVYEFSIEELQDIYYSLFDETIKENNRVKKVQTTLEKISHEEITAFLEKDISKDSFEVCKKAFQEHGDLFSILFSYVHIPEKQMHLKSVSFFLLVFSVLLFDQIDNRHFEKILKSG